jgi:hypothetical protein
MTDWKDDPRVHALMERLIMTFDVQDVVESLTDAQLAAHMGEGLLPFVPMDSKAFPVMESVINRLLRSHGGPCYAPEPLLDGGAAYSETSEQIAVNDAVLHPTGRCTCAGEGTCEWCRDILVRQIAAVVDDEYGITCDMHRCLQRADGVMRLDDGRWVQACDACRRKAVIEADAQRAAEGEGGES